MAFYVRHRIDVTMPDALAALVALVRPATAGASAAGSRPEELVCLSVRSAFHLLLSAARFPAGSDVVISAVTHPDMVRIIELHGLRAVPVDVDPDTLAVDEAALRAAVTDRTCLLVVTHLFGARAPLDAPAATARDRGLLLVEDCAQSLQGPDDRGDPRADVSLFSFGLLKTATAMGGALACVRRPGLAARMRARQSRWPMQSRREYAGKVLTAMAAVLLAHPAPYGLLFDGRVRRDPTVLVRSRVPREEEAFGRWLRRRPCDALVRTVRRRLAHFPSQRLRRRAEAGSALAAMLPPGLFRPGASAQRHTHWVFPVAVDEPEQAIRVLRVAGIDASGVTSQIAAVEPAPPGARRVLTGVVFLPAYPELPASQRKLMATVLASGS